MQNKQYELWLDMDETFVDLSKYVVNYYNLDFNDNFDYTKNNSYWWSDCSKAPKIYFEYMLKQQGTFLNPEPIENSIDVITKLHNEGFQIHIITMPQFDSLYCVQEKIQWVQKYLPFINVKTNVHFSGNKGVMAKSNRILLDDNSEHLFSWQSQGGLSIAFKNFGWNQDWKGMRVNSFNEFYDLIHRYDNGKRTLEESINLHNLRSYYINKLHK